MSSSSVFEVKTNLPTTQLDILSKKLLGFEGRYQRIQKRLQLILQSNELERWSQKHHDKKLAVIELLNEQYPLAIFHGDVGTGKTANAEAIANRLARDAKIEDAILYKLSNKVRGTARWVRWEHSSPKHSKIFPDLLGRERVEPSSLLTKVTL